MSHATSLEHNANAQVHLNITKRNLIYYSNRTYLGLSKHGKAYVAQPRRRMRAALASGGGAEAKTSLAERVCGDC